ncbi:hypothetical protein N665_1597s0002 [Sinapis alba]|nr:hypothetical protein N665_1597s0002 [Sinapis alba]
MISRRLHRIFLPVISTARSFRSDAALEAISNALEEKVPNLILYNYPSFSGAFSALFAHLYHSRLRIPSLILPFSSVVPFKVKDLCLERFERCYLLDFVAPKDFADTTDCEIICFDHRKSAASKLGLVKKRFKVNVDIDKSSSKAVYEYFSSKLTSSEGESLSLLDDEDKTRIESVLDYIEDIDLRRWRLPDVKAFSFGLKEWRSRVNSITNPYMYEQLLRVSSEDLTAYGNSYFSTRLIDAKRVLKQNKAFKIRLGRGFYGECLGMRADGNHELSDELGKLLSLQSASSGLRPIGAVTFMQRNNLKMCLRSTDDTADTSEIAKAYGGGGTSCSSSFIIRMDEYNQWISMNPT